ncbi:MAG: 2,3-bisphosphoglycerate-independent phosphoglycerate mutase [Bacilli bacterium]|nr:2,3-bisphosphoglycerate-independent phosphoglycerate mutase [Bacilli bacterium]
MKPVVLCILDGVGMREEVYGNAVAQAHMPNFNSLLKKYPHSLLEASGPSVGLPEGQMGNSEVGHMNIGAGRTMYQPLELINQKIKDQTFYQNEELLDVIAHTKKNNSKLHLIGLLSDGGVHSHINHLFALIELCKKEKVENVYLHLFLDGRDTLSDTALTYIEALQKKIEDLPNFQIATIGGRYYAMDRDNRWERVIKEYNILANGENPISDISMYIKENYANTIYDEFIVPATVNKKGLVQDHDGIIAFNFRPDRLREIGKALTDPTFDGFERSFIKDLKMATLMKVSEEVKSKAAFSLEETHGLLGEVLSAHHLKQLRIAETEKYAHVTYFFDGGNEKVLEGEDRVLVPSSHVATYDLKPEMSAGEITDILLEKLEANLYDVVILNYANGDMVGHTGNMEATKRALEALDLCLGKLYQKIEEKGGTLLITADHGNSDEMLDKMGHVITSHSLSKVPFIVTKEGISLQDGKLGDIAPTMLSLLGISAPAEMTGENLIK